MYPSDAAGVILQTTESSAGEKSPLGARRAKIEEGVAAYAFALDDGGEGDGIVGSDGKVWVSGKAAMRPPRRMSRRQAPPRRSRRRRAACGVSFSTRKTAASGPAQHRAQRESCRHR
jgi:hypothetical protein